MPGVKAVITGKDLEAAGLGWLPTFHGFDKQMVLAIGKVLFQYQEVAAVFAETRAAAVDGAEAVQVDYAPLPVVADPFTSKTDKVLLRPDRESKTNHIFHWEVGDKDGAARALASSAKRIKQRIWFQRCHPAPLEPCGCVAYFDTMGRLQFHVTSQAPHVYRTALALVTGIAEDKIHVISPDLGGGFGNKVPVYPGYVCAIVGALKIGRPVKWIETRTENLTSTGFARDYHMDVEIGATADGRVTALHVATTADHGAFDAAADPSKYPAGIFGIVTGSYDFPVAHAEVDAYFTNKAPGGIAYRCSFRVTEASYAIERGMDILADELGHGRRGAAQEEFHPEGSVPLSVGAGVHLRQRRLSQDARRGAREDRLPGAAEGAGGEARARRADGHRLLDVHRGRRRRAVEALRHPRHQDVRQRRDPHPPDGRRHRAHGHEVAGPGARDDVGADRRRGAGARSADHHGRGGRHRHGAVRSGHLRQPQHAGRRRRHRDGRAPHSREGAEDCRASARGRRGRRRVDRLQVPGEGRAGEDRHHEGGGVCGLHEHGAERAGARSDVLLRSAEHDVSERRVRGGRGRRSRDRRREGAPLPRGGRLRHRHQSDDRRRADSRRADRRVRDGVHPGDPVRRRGQQPEHQLHRLPGAHLARDAALGDGQHRDAEPASSDGREGRRREPECRQPGGVRQRGRRCAVAARRPAHRHADEPDKVWRAIRDAEARK